MKEKDLPFDRTKHTVYTKNAKKCVKKLLRRYYDEKTSTELWEKIQLQYCEYLKDEPALAGSKITVSIYDPILIFAWYTVIPDKPPIEDIQQDIYDCFMGSFDLLGKIFNLNRSFDMWLIDRVFRRSGNRDRKDIQLYPDGFINVDEPYDKERHIARYSFTQCPNAEFAKKHNMNELYNNCKNAEHSQISIMWQFDDKWD
jgi:hypothetical protein